MRKKGLPERTRDSVSPGDVGGLEESSGPRPLTDDDGGGKARLDHTTGRAFDPDKRTRLDGCMGDFPTSGTVSQRT